MIGRFAKNNFKHFEYTACSSFSVSCRAAIEGGLDSATTYALSDLAKQRLEKCTSINEIINLMRDVRLDFATRVNEIKKNKSHFSYIEKSKTFINNNLNTPITLEDIAKQVNMNPSYLSRTFSKEVGVGIQKYIQQKRIEVAKNMLKYSDVTMTVIVNYLCFPSQSHFGKVFKDAVGISPSKYRAQEQLVDF